MRDNIGGDMMLYHDSASTWYFELACRSMGTGFPEAAAENDETAVIWRLMATINYRGLVELVGSGRSPIGSGS